MKEHNQNILSKKLILFQRMKELAGQQKKLLQEDSLDHFMSLLAQRGLLQQKIDQQDELAGKKEAGIGTRLRGAEAMDISRQIGEVIRSIQETDQKIEELMLRQKNDIIQEIQGLRHSKKAVKGYGGRPGRIPRYIDQHK